MIKYAPSGSNPYPYVDLKLSPISRFILELATDVICNNRNLVVEFPSSFSNLPLLIANHYSYFSKKSTLIFTKKERVDGYNDVYYRLLDDAVEYRSRVPISIKTSKGIKLKEKFLKNVSSTIRSKYRDSYSEDLFSSEKPIIILVSEDEFIEDINGINIDVSKTNGKGLAIFDNLSTKDIARVEKIIDWCNRENIRYLFFTNIATPRFYEMLKSNENIFFIPFHNGIVEVIDDVNKSITQYFNEADYLSYKDVQDVFNIDHKYNYSNSVDVEISIIQNGRELGSILKDISQSISRLNDADMSLRKEILSLAKSAYESVDSFLTPDYITKYSSYSNNRINGIGFCENIHNMSKSYSGATRYLCELIVSSFWSIRNILEKCKSPVYDNGYQKENKLSRLFALINEYAISDMNIFVVTSNNNEIKYLSTLLNKQFPELSHRLFISGPSMPNEKKARSGILILSGRLEYNQLSILDLPFQRKIILAYIQDNEYIIKNLIEMYKTVDGYRKQLFLESLNLLREKLSGSSKYFNKYEFLCTLESNLKINVSNSSHNIQDHLNSLKKDMCTKYQAISEFLKDKADIDKFSTKLDTDLDADRERSIRESNEYYELALKNIYTGAIVKTISGIGTIHTFIDNNGELSEAPITLDSKNRTIIEVPGKRTSLLDMLIEWYGLDDDIDKTVIELWENGLRSYELSYRTLNDFYDAYIKCGGEKTKQTVRLWLRRELLGPRDLEDIRLVGKVLSIDELCSECDYIFKELEKIRKMKRQLGKHLSRVISIAIGKSESVEDDPFSNTMWEKVKQYMFRIESIKQIQ